MENCGVLHVLINADDFGLTDGVCAGIVQAIRSGGVTATTAMACVPGAIERLRRWAPAIPGRIGAHLQLTGGSPILRPESIPSLVGADGRFPATRKEVKAPRTEEVLVEWRAQMQALLRAGIHPTHLDTHHHIHRLPSVFAAFCEIAKEYALPARSLGVEMTRTLRSAGIRGVDRTVMDWYGGNVSATSFMKLLSKAAQEFPEAERFEVMCHPGMMDTDLPARSRYVNDRERELAVLCGASFRQKVFEAGFVLVTPNVMRED